mgnify:FL=1
MKDYLFKFIFIMIIIFLSYPSLSKDIVKVKKVHPPKCLLLKETNGLLCPRIMEVDVTIRGEKEKHLVRCTLFSEEEEILAFGEAFIIKPEGKLFLTLRTRTRIHGLTLIAGAKCSSDPY